MKEIKQGDIFWIRPEGPDESELGFHPHPYVVVSKVSAVDKAQLGEYIGSLGEERVKQILAGMRFLEMGYYGRL